MPPGFGPPSSAAPSPLAGLLGALGAGMQGFMQGRQFRDQERRGAEDQAAKMFDVYRTIAQAHPEAVKDPNFMHGVSQHLTALGLPADQLGQALTALTPEQQIAKDREALERRKSGADIQLPEKMQYLPPGATPDQEANHYRHLAAYYAARGADDQAGKYENMAKDAMNEYNRRSADAQRFQMQFQQLAERIRADKQREGHWSRSDDARLQAIQAGLQGRIVTGEYSVERALIDAQNRITTTGMRDETQLSVADKREQGQNDRMVYRVQNNRVDKEYKAAMDSWDKNQAQAAIAMRMNKPMPPGWSQVAGKDGQPQLVGPAKPISPDDFAAKVNDTLDLIRSSKATSKQAIQMIGQLPGITPSQRAEAIKAFSNPTLLRGSDDPGPFPQYPR